MDFDSAKNNTYGQDSLLKAFMALTVGALPAPRQFQEKILMARKARLLGHLD